MVNNDFRKHDQELGCVRLQWEFHDDPVSRQEGSKIVESVDPGKWFGVTPVESIVGMLPLVPAEHEIYSKGHRKSNSAHFHEETPWFKQQFYINRFFTVMKKIYTL